MRRIRRTFLFRPTFWYGWGHPELVEFPLDGFFPVRRFKGRKNRQGENKGMGTSDSLEHRRKANRAWRLNLTSNKRMLN